MVLLISKVIFFSYLGIHQARQSRHCLNKVGRLG